MFDVDALISQMEEAINQVTGGRETSEAGKKLATWAQSLFDDAIIAALPLTNAKKKFTRLDFAKATDFFKKVNSQFSKLQS